MLNTVLDLTATACLIAPIVLFVFHTIRYIASPTCQTAAPIVPPVSAVEAAPAASPLPPVLPVAPAALAMPVARLSIAAETNLTTAYQSLSAAELRKLCTAAQIRWRNAFGKNHHLSKREMIAALVG
jgi:hypothetical protein